MQWERPCDPFPILVRGIMRESGDDLPQGQRRRYYHLTDAGRARLGEMHRYWRHLTAAVEGLLSGEKP